MSQVKTAARSADPTATKSIGLLGIVAAGFAGLAFTSKGSGGPLGLDYVM
jgi:hypothetical protein